MDVARLESREATPNDAQSAWRLYGRYEASRLSVVFGGRGKAARKRRVAWIGRLPEEQAEKVGGRWHVRGDALLPNGETVQQYAQGMPQAKLPGIAREASNRKRQKMLDFLEFERMKHRFDQEHSSLSPSSGASWEAFIAVHGAWARERGLPCSRSQYYALQHKMSYGKDIDGRGKPPREPEVFVNGIPVPHGCSAEACELFLSMYMATRGGRNQLSIAQCCRYVEGEAKEHGWEWPSYSTVRTWIHRKIPHGAKTYARKGPKKFEASCVPKIQRDYEQIAASAWWCLDGTPMDIMCRVPDDRKNWRRARVILTGINDMRSRMLVGWDVRSTESADGILAGIRMAMRGHGAPEHAIVDNGKAYKAATGARRGTKRQRNYFADKRIGSVFAQTGVQTHTSIPYHSWAKQIESLWNKVKNGFDRWFWCFWGGSPDERPEGMDRWTKERIDELPTVEEVREAFAIFLDEYHATEQSGDGTYGLSPNQIMEQFRGPIRRVDDSLLDLLCCRTVGPVKVHRDGIRYKHVLYGQKDEAIWKLQGREVWLRIDPDRVDRVTVCQEDGRPICYAHNTRLSGATQEDLREAMRAKARYRKQMKAYMPARDFLLETPTTQILQAKRRHAMAREAEQRKQLPEPETPPVTLVRPDLVKDAKRLEREERRRQGTAGTRAGRRVERRSNLDENPFDTLAKKADSDRSTQPDPLLDINPGDLFAEVYGDEITPVEEDAWGCAG